MPHLLKKRQTVHDRKVREVARRLRKAGYFVRADLPGHKKPFKIGGVIPDVYAHKKGKKVLYEIETSQTLKRDLPMQKKLAKATQKIGAEFRLLVV